MGNVIIFSLGFFVHVHDLTFSQTKIVPVCSILRFKYFTLLKGWEGRRKRGRDRKLMYIYLCWISALGDTFAASCGGGGATRKNSDSGTFTNDIIKTKFAETSISIGDILENDGQITLPLTDESNQSSIKKVTDTISNSDWWIFPFHSFLFNIRTFDICFCASKEWTSHKKNIKIL